MQCNQCWSVFIDLFLFILYVQSIITVVCSVIHILVYFMLPFLSFLLSLFACYVLILQQSIVHRHSFHNWESSMKVNLYLSSRNQLKYRLLTNSLLYFISIFSWAQACTYKTCVELGMNSKTWPKNAQLYNTDTK